jgi:tetratricopeptide (TPR) repeat protein
MTNNFDDYEDWEAISEFTEEEDWTGLVKWAETGFNKHPNEYYYQYNYGSALIQNSEYKKAIEVLTQAYNIHFDSTDVVHSILEALFLSGKTENDFKWKVPPEILLLNDLTIQTCETFLKGKRKYTSFTDIYCDLVVSGAYLKFSEEELHDFLIKSDKFDVIPETPDSFFVTNSKFKNRLKKNS